MDEPEQRIMSVRDMVNLSQYPIVDLRSPVGLAFAQKCRSEYAVSGLCMLPHFISPRAIRILSEEANAISSKAYFCEGSHNAYLSAHNPQLAPDDVARRQQKTFVGSVAYDQIAEKTNLRRLYNWDSLKDFIGHVLGKTAFHRFADPFGACSINVFVDGGEHGWHFDESEFTVTLMLQQPETGGSFEYVPLIRGLENEKAIIAKILDGDYEGITELPFSPGTLLIFGGKHTLHRVTRVNGPTPRLVPVLCYSELPNLQNSEAVRELFWGRSGPEMEASYR